MEGFMLIDKPKGISSHGVVARLRKITGIKRIGHGGTLDPNATGLLVLGVGRSATKQLGEFADGKNKDYQATMFLGETRDTDDIEGKVEEVYQGPAPSRKKLTMALRSFSGPQVQIPPRFSAIKVGGRPAYKMARKGEVFELKKRKVVIHELKLISYSYPKLEIFCSVSAGTYIRTLARDIGAKLGTGAYLRELRRTKVGKFSVEQAASLESLTTQNWLKFLIPSGEVLAH